LIGSRLGTSPIGPQPLRQGASLPMVPQDLNMKILSPSMALIYHHCILAFQFYPLGKTVRSMNLIEKKLNFHRIATDIPKGR